MMRKEKTKTSMFTVPPFYADVMAQRGGNLQDFERKFAKKSKVDIEVTPEYLTPSGRTFWVEGRKEVGIWLAAGTGQRILSHEVFHAVCWMIRGLKPSTSEKPLVIDATLEEVFAYSMGFIAARLAKDLY